MDQSVLIGAALGIPASLSAAYFYDIIKYMTEKWISRLDIEGEWGEFIPESKGRQFSVGKIYRDRRRRMLAFDGTNFSNDGTPYCRWHTISSYMDLEKGQFFYIFHAEVEGQLDVIYSGFGVIYLCRGEKGKLVPDRGYYVSASIDEKGMSHSMVRIPVSKYGRELSTPDAIAVIKSSTPKPQRAGRRAA